MSRKTKRRNKSEAARRCSKNRDAAPKTASRAGSNFGRGFRYQDAVAALLAVEIWSGRRAPAVLIPEGGDDVELQGDDRIFVQIKSRREHLGDYPKSDASKHIKDLWKRCLGASTQPNGSELVLERNVTGFSPIGELNARRAVDGPLARQLSDFEGFGDLLPNTSITIAASPQESAIAMIVDRLNCTPIAAQFCYADLLARVGALADENGRLAPEAYRGISISDTERSIRDVLTAVDVDAIERALLEGACESVDFLTPLDDPNFYLGVDVEPGHIAAGLVAERPRSRTAVAAAIEERRAALIVGPSGAGKSALMWEVSSALRHTVRWFRIRRLGVADIPAMRQLMRTFRASERSPVGFIMDDVGRTGPESWGALLKEAMSVPGVVMLGSIREEDATLIAERARAAEIRPEPDDELAERVWRELREAERTEWEGWREPWMQSEGLLLEYVHILTRGRRMHDVLFDQVAARTSDPARALELDILRSGAWAGAANATIDAVRLANILSVSDAEMSRALQRLIEEHLVRSPAPGAIAGLHQLRSEELLRLTHQAPLPTLETSFNRTVASVPPSDLELLVDDALSRHRLSVDSVLNSVLVRLEKERDPVALASALRGLGAGRISAGVGEWLETDEAKALPRTQIGSAAMFGIAGLDLSNLSVIPTIQAAADRLVEIKGSPEADPRRHLLERMPQPILSELIKSAHLTSLNEILGALTGLPLSDSVRAALKSPPANVLAADLSTITSVLGSLTALDRDIAIEWVADIGQEALFAKIQTETAWAGDVSIEDTDDGKTVHCDYWYVAEVGQGNPHDAVVQLCETIMVLCPSADFAKSNAITASGALAGLADFPLASKRIPRENIPPPSIPEWNKRWRKLIARRVASPSYSDYLARGVAILEDLTRTLEKIFDAHLRGKDALGRLFQELNSLNAAAEALTPPSMSALEASGTGEENANDAVTKFQNLLFSTSVNLIKRFALLPQQAGAYIGWLNDLIADIDQIIAEEPWELIASTPPQALLRLKFLLETLRVLAGESHERQQSPAATWAARGKNARPGNAVRLVSLAATGAGEKRLAERIAEIEQSAEDEGLAAVFHIRLKADGITPWPPADILALTPARDLEEAAIVLSEQIGPLRALVDHTIHLTVLPVVNNVGVPALAKAGHQTLLPDIEGARGWADQIGLQFAPSTTAILFGEALALAIQLGAMDRLGLGVEGRPDAEDVVYRDLENSLRGKRVELDQRLETFENGTKTAAADLIDHMRTGKTDFASEAQIVLNGATTPMSEAVGYVMLLLIEHEL